MSKATGGFTYILTNKSHSVLYVVITSNIRHRLWQHQTMYYPTSFSSKYNTSKLIYYKSFDDIRDAIDYEKFIKGKSRQFKEKLISEENPQWRDLSDEIEEMCLL